MLGPDDIRHARFPTVRRGLDRDDVEAFLGRIALEMEHTALFSPEGLRGSGFAHLAAPRRVESPSVARDPAVNDVGAMPAGASPSMWELAVFGVSTAEPNPQRAEIMSAPITTNPVAVPPAPASDPIGLQLRLMGVESGQLVAQAVRQADLVRRRGA